MSDALEARVKAVFQRALEMDTASRPAYLERVCKGQDELRGRLDALFAAYEDAGEFLAEPEPVEVEEGVGTVIDRYKLLQIVGEGGFGTVYMAEQSEPVRRRVALKVIKLGMDTKEVIARFEAERQALAMMDHPNIAKVLDAGATPKGRPYFVMELVRGIPITEYCDQAGLDTPERLGLFQKVCEAVQHAHQKGVIHRDIKPSNVLVTLHDGVPVPKVIDFGIAKATDHRLTEKTFFTELHQIIGTPEYMAPEQAEMSGLDVDTRADVYSLGVLLYELLTGTTPFDVKTLLREGFGAVLKYIREIDPPKPSSRVSTMQEERLVSVAKQRDATPQALGKLIRGDLDWIVMKALEKDRTRRYETANALALDIGRYKDDEPVVARPPSATYRLRKYVRRNRVAVMAVSAVGLAILMGAGLALLGYLEADQQLARARRAEGTALTEAKEAGRQRDLAQVAQERADRETAEAKRERDASDRRLGLISKLMRSLQLERAEKSRERWSGAFLAGLQDALDRDEPSDVFFFLEHARIDPLLGFLNSSARIQKAEVPTSLKADEIAARAAQVEARRKFDWLRARGAALRVQKAASKELASAKEQLEKAVLAAQAAARGGAASAAQLPATLEQAQAGLRANQGYVAIAVLPMRTYALIVTRSSARIVRLGLSARIDEAVARLDLSEDPDRTARVIGELKERLAEPLGLPPEVKQVLLSPEGGLLAVPLGLLLPEREVAFTPSATTYLSLLESGSAKGNSVLAVGDPIPAKGSRVSKLPATRKEVRAIGSTILLHEEAIVSRFRAALEQEQRWRAVHLACHGLVNRERPLMSALALTGEADHDGMFTALDVSQTRIEADLVTLSACESGSGAIKAGGGIGALTRAFLFAGASRVLVSLGTVDDEATTAFMTKFYGLWNPKDPSQRMGAGAALKAAQAHVRSQKKWVHPRFWAAWTIWGLVD